MFPDVNAFSYTSAPRLGFGVHQHRSQDAKLQEDPAFQRDGYTDRRNTRYGIGAAVCASISPFSQEGRQQTPDIIAEAKTIQESHDARIQDPRGRDH